MSQETVTSAGKIGIDHQATYGRSRANVPGTITSSWELGDLWAELNDGARKVGNRRALARAVCSREVSQHAIEGLPVEVRIPLAIVNTDRDDSLIVLGRNRHRWGFNERRVVDNYWESPQRESDPELRIARLEENNTSLSSGLSFSESSDLFRFWGETFEWTRKQIDYFIRDSLGREGVWFSAVRSRQDGRLLAACTAEGIRQGGENGVDLVELTEFSVDPGERGKGFCTAAVIGLIAQVARSYRNRETPVIFSENNLLPSSRADIVARQVGMVRPSEQCVLPGNVAVFDGRPNELNEDDLSHLSEGARHGARHLRNFLLTVLPLTEFGRYQGEMGERILMRMER